MSFRKGKRQSPQISALLHEQNIRNDFGGQMQNPWLAERNSPLFSAMIIPRKLRRKMQTSWLVEFPLHSSVQQNSPESCAGRCKPPGSRNLLTAPRCKTPARAARKDAKLYDIDNS